MPLKSIPAHGRAFVFLTAIGGGLAVGVNDTVVLVAVGIVQRETRLNQELGGGLYDYDLARSFSYLRVTDPH